MSMGPRPFLAAALVCERVLQEGDGTISVIRIIDNIEIGLVAAPGMESPAALSPPTVNLAFLVAVKAGDTHGEQKFRVTIVAPSGKPLVAPIEFAAFFSRPESGHNMILNIGFQVREPGLHWLEVAWADDPAPIGRTPFRIDLPRPTPHPAA